MPKDRDLVDYLKLGNELIQTSQLGDIREAQRASAILDAARLEADQREANTRRREDNIRELVFSAAKLVEGLERLHATSNPSGTLVTMYELARHIEDLNVRPSSVRTYEDKQKVHAFLSNVSRIIAECEKRLDAEALQNVKTCVQYRAEQSDLKALLCYKARQRLVPADDAQEEDRDEEDRDLDEPEMENQKPVVFRFFAIFGAILIPVALLIAVAEGKLPRPVDSPILSIALAVGAAVIIFVLARYGAEKRPVEDTLQVVEDEPNESKKEELALMMERRRVRHLESKFGAGSYDDCKEEFLKRTALVGKVMGYDDSSDDSNFLLLSCEGEDVERERTPQQNAPVVIFGNEAPSRGWFFSGLGEFANVHRANLLLNTPPQRREYIKRLIDHGYTLFFKADGRITIFTRLKLRISPEAVESLKTRLRMTRETLVDHNGRVEPAAKFFDC